MPVTVEKKAFSNMDGAYDQLKARKLWPLTSANAFLEREQPHWHPYNNQIFVLEGEADFFDGETGAAIHATPGDIIRVPARTLHAVEAKNEVTFFVCFDRPIKRDEMVALKPEELDA